MNSNLILNLAKRTIKDDSGAQWSPPVCTFKDDLNLVIGFERSVGSTTLPTSYTVTALACGVGNIDARPIGGNTCIQIGSGASTANNTTSPINWDAGPETVANAINAIAAVVTAHGSVAVKYVNGSYLLKWTKNGVVGPEQIPLSIVNNYLFPATLGRVFSWQLGGEWVHEIRFVQVPVAFTDSLASSLPNAPTVKEIISGGSAEGVTWNEVQQLTIPPDFAGTFRLLFNTVPSDPIDRTDTTASITTALAPIGTFKLTDQADLGVAWMEFTDARYSGSPEPLMTVQVVSAPAASIKVTLDLGKGTLFAMLRSQPSVTLPLHLKIQLQDPDDSSSIVTCQLVTNLTIQRDLLFDELATVPQIDWLRRLDEKTYVPFGDNNTITGQQFYSAALGDGGATAFPVAHPLATETVSVILRENISGGRILTLGKSTDPNADYSCTVDSNSQVTITALNGFVPAASAWELTIVSAGTVAAFAAGLTVTIAQVTGLQTQLNALSSAIAAIQALLPSVTPGVPASSSQSVIVTYNVTDQFLLFPSRTPLVTGMPSLQNLPRAEPLFPAIHTNSVTSFTTLPLPTASSTAGAVWQNNTGAALTINGAGGNRSYSLPTGGYFGSDGRFLYPLTNATGTTSYFPTWHEQEFFVLDINDDELHAATILNVSLNLTLQLFNASSKVRCLFVIEWADISQDTSPATTAPNLAAISWNTTPLLKQVIDLSGIGTTHSFACNVVRSGIGVLTANKERYGIWNSADSVPDSPNFLLRARLINFDTEDGAVKPTGLIYANLTGVQAQIVTS